MDKALLPATSCNQYGPCVNQICVNSWLLLQFANSTWQGTGFGYDSILIPIFITRTVPLLALSLGFPFIPDVKDRSAI